MPGLVDQSQEPDTPIPINPNIQPSINPCSLSLRQRLVHFPLVKKPLFRLELPRIEDPDLFSIGPIHTENPRPAGGHPQVEEPRLNGKPGGVRQYPQGKRVFKRLFYLSLRQRTIEIEGRIFPIKLHIELICKSLGHAMSLQCIYTYAFGLSIGFRFEA